MVRLRLALAAMSGVALGTGVARGDPRAECVQAYEAAQIDRNEGKLASARQKLQACARDTCPQIIRVDCVNWLREVESSLPSIVVRVTTPAGDDVADARVLIDGALASEKTDGRAIGLDPGEHTLRVEYGSSFADRRIVVGQGEKNRTIALELSAPPAVPAAAATAPAPIVTPVDQPDRSDGPPTAAWVLGGVSVVSLGVFAYLGITGMRDLDNLRSECAPSCKPDERDRIKRQLLIADIALGVGVVTGAAAAYLFISDRSKPEQTGIRVAPFALPGGAGVVTGRRF